MLVANFQAHRGVLHYRKGLTELVYDCITASKCGEISRISECLFDVNTTVAAIFPAAADVIYYKTVAKNICILANLFI